MTLPLPLDAKWREGCEPDFRPMRIVTIPPGPNDVCDRCGDAPVRDVLDGDYLCQSCCEAWARGEQPEDDLAPLSHPVMQAAFGRISDARLQHISAGHRRFERNRGVEALSHARSTDGDER